MNRCVLYFWQCLHLTLRLSDGLAVPAKLRDLPGHAVLSGSGRRGKVLVSLKASQPDVLGWDPEKDYEPPSADGSEEVLACPKNATRCVVATIGDSISTLYPQILEWELRQGEEDGRWHVRNYAQNCVSASRSVNESAYCGGIPFKTLPSFQYALDLKADYVFMMFGTAESARTNFSEQEFQSGYKDLIARFKAVRPPPKKIYIMKPPPMYPARHSPSDVGFDPVIANSVVQRLVPTVVKDEGVVLLDAFEPLGGSRLDKPDYFDYDGVHPNSFGSCAIANVAFGALRNGKHLDCGVPPVSE